MACSVAVRRFVAHPGGEGLEGAVVAKQRVRVREAGQHGQRAAFPVAAVSPQGRGLLELANG